MKVMKVPPRAASFFQSMRDLGYILDTALADIIDNSISALSKNIDIFAISNESFHICIIDDGYGMTQDELIEGMRYASKDPRDQRGKFDLGRFGLGLKLASLSQCRKLTVVSKKNNTLSAAIWNQDHIDKVNDWEIIIPDPLTIPYVDKIGSSGTLVLWENIDVFELNGNHEQNQKNFTDRIARSRKHLELVFHRFLSQDGSKRIPCIIRINGDPLVSFDPFHSLHPSTQKSPTEWVDDDVSLTAYTLPHHSQVSEVDWLYFGGEEGYLKNQGLYIYREKRLIVHGTWLKLMRQTELTKLTRVRVDISNRVDREWNINVDKSKASIPLNVRERVNGMIDGIGNPSKRIFLNKGQKLTSPAIFPAWESVQDKNKRWYQVNSEHPFLKAFSESIPEDTVINFLKVLNFISASLPLDELYVDISNDETKIDIPELDDKLLEEGLIMVFDKFPKTYSSDDILRELKRQEPFRSTWDRCMFILEKMGRINA